MGLKYYTDPFTAYDTSTYTVEIHQEGYSGATTRIDRVGTGTPEVAWEPDNFFGADEFGTVFLIATMRLLIRDEDASIALDLQSKPEGVFQMHLKKGGGDFLTVNVVPSETRQTADERGNTTEIRGNDFGYLTGRAFTDVRAATGSRTPVQLLSQLLSDLAPADLYVFNNWFPFGGPSATEDVLDTITVNLELYADVEGEERWTSADVIRHLVGPFGCQVMQAEGFYWIVQREYREESTMRYHLYPQDYHSTGTGHTTATALLHRPVSNEFLRRVSGGSYATLFDYGAAAAVYEHGEISADFFKNPGFEPENASAPGDLAPEWNRAGSPPVYTTAMNKRAIEGGFSQEIQGLENTTGSTTDYAAMFAIVEGQYLWQASSEIAQDDQISFTIDVTSKDQERFVAFVSVQMGSYWLAEDGSWSLTPEYIYTEPRLNVWNTISWQLSEPAPENGTLQMRVHAPVKKQLGPIAGTGAVLHDNITWQYYPNGSREANRTIYVASPASAATASRPSANFFHGDGPVSAVKGSFLLGGSATKDWQRGATYTTESGHDITALWAGHVVQGRQTRMHHRHEGTYYWNSINAPFDIYAAPVLNGIPYAQERLRWIVMEGRYDTTMYVLKRDGAPFTIAIGKEFTEGTSGRGGGTIIGETGGDLPTDPTFNTVTIQTDGHIGVESNHFVLKSIPDGAGTKNVILRPQDTGFVQVDSALLVEKPTLQIGGSPAVLSITNPTGKAKIEALSSLLLELIGQGITSEAGTGTNSVRGNLVTLISQTGIFMQALAGAISMIASTDIDLTPGANLKVTASSGDLDADVQNASVTATTGNITLTAEQGAALIGKLGIDLSAASGPINITAGAGGTQIATITARKILGNAIEGLFANFFEADNQGVTPSADPTATTRSQIYPNRAPDPSEGGMLIQKYHDDTSWEEDAFLPAQHILVNVAWCEIENTGAYGSPTTDRPVTRGKNVLHWNWVGGTPEDGSTISIELGSWSLYGVNVESYSNVSATLVPATKDGNPDGDPLSFLFVAKDGIDNLTLYFACWEGSSRYSIENRSVRINIFGTAPDGTFRP